MIFGVWNFINTRNGNILSSISQIKRLYPSYIMTAKKKSVGIVPFGNVDETVLNIISDNISGCFNIPTQILAPVNQPEYALDERRLQYNAAMIIEYLESVNFDNYDKTIGVLNQDLFIPIFTHVFGEARQGGRCGLVSLFRLRKNTDGSSPCKALIHERVAKVALHELGHLFDLLHCENKRCLMHFSGGLEELDEMSPDFCKYCSVYLQDRM